MEVSQAIKNLLFLEECVIIPGLGGFVSNYRPAVIDKPTGTFIPPAKEIVFNPGLVQNDGVLVGYLAQKSGITQEFARREVDTFVQDSLLKLESGQPVFIAGIGQFFRGKSGETGFQADPGTNLFLDSFGLAPFHLREVFRDEPLTMARTLVAKHDDLPVTIEFPAENAAMAGGNRHLWRIAIAMPLLVAFSLLPYNSRLGDRLSSSPASMIPEPSLFRLNYPDSQTRDTSRVIEFPVKAVIGDEAKGEEVKGEEVNKKEVVQPEVKPATVAEDVKPAVVGKYAVIAGCFKVQANAEKLHKLLVDKGYPAIINTTRTGLFKVIVESYSTRDEAVSGLARIKSAEPGMDLWAQI